MISNSRFHSITLGVSAQLILPEGKKRKSFLIQNTSSSITVRFGNFINLNDNAQYIEIPPNSVLTMDIPEDNPREQFFARAASGTATIRIYQSYSRD